jgi:hypothetical protein
MFFSLTTLSDDTTGSFIIDANITHDVGQPITAGSSIASGSLSITISLSSTSSLPSFNVPLNTGSF